MKINENRMNYLLTILMMSNICFGKVFFVNINMDYLSTEEIKIESQENFTNCSFLKSKGASTTLDLLNLTSSQCTAGNDTVNLFIYYTNITSAIITIKNENNAMESIRNMSRNITVLKYNTDYISFVVCDKSIVGCQYKSVDRASVMAADQKLYSACSNPVDQDSCLTVIEFEKTISYKDSIIGTTIIVKNLTKNDDYKLNCHNEGTRIEGTDKCQCKNTDAFIKHGPQCEALQQKLSETQYLYVLPNSKNLEIEFSLSSPAHSKITKIMEIRDIFNYTINESLHQFQFQNNAASIKYPLDTNHIWLDILVNISTSDIKFKINEKKTEKSGNFKKLAELDNVPLIIYDQNNPKQNLICMSNLKVNGRIIDLYTPVYKDCVENRCKGCSENCYYVPFKSDGNVNCVCKTGFSNSKNCSSEKSIAKTLRSNDTKSKSIGESNIMEARFRFRTLLDNGTLVTFVISQSFNFTISIGTMTQGIWWTISPYSKNVTKCLTSCTDGEWHTVQITITKYLFEITIDENLRNSQKIWFDNSILPGELLNFPKVSGINFGPLSHTSQKSSNLTACFDTFVIMDNANKYVQIPNLFDEMDDGCNSGTNCSSITCKQYERCEYQWQNSTCLCEQNFIKTNLSDTCTFNKCIPNPCKNNGECIYNNVTKDLQCLCHSSFNGIKCENRKGFLPWWVYLLIALAIFIIIVTVACILYWRCSRHDPVKSNINRIHENVVHYNQPAGEEDYKGKPIDFDILKYRQENIKKYEQLHKRKKNVDEDDKCMVLDHPLEYGYEGDKVETESLSSIGSKSTDEKLNILPIQSLNDNFLKNLYM